MFLFPTVFSTRGSLECQVDFLWKMVHAGCRPERRDFGHLLAFSGRRWQIALYAGLGLRFGIGEELGILARLFSFSPPGYLEYFIGGSEFQSNDQMISGPFSSFEALSKIVVIVLPQLSLSYHHVSYWWEFPKLWGFWNRVFALIRKVSGAPVPQLPPDGLAKCTSRAALLSITDLFLAAKLTIVRSNNLLS